MFDASAVLAMLFNEPGGDRARALLDEDSAISLVNVGEVAGKMVKRGSTSLDALFAVSELNLRWMQVDPTQIERVGELGAVKDLSLADRFCIALAESRNEPLVTADRDWLQLPLSVPVEMIR